MYLALPFVYLLGKRIRWPVLLIGVGFVVMYSESWITRDPGFPTLFKCVPWFFMGTCAYFQLSERRFSSVAYGAYLGVFVCAALAARRFLPPHEVVWADRAFGIVFCLLLPSFREITSTLAKRCFHVIAKYSYGIYLAHFSVMWFAFKRLTTSSLPLQWLVFVVLMVAVPVALYNLIEEPFIKAGGRLAKAMSGQTQPL